MANYDNVKNRFNSENRFIGDIENDVAYPFACYTKPESDSRYAVKEIETTVSEINDRLNETDSRLNAKANASDIVNLTEMISLKADATALDGKVDKIIGKQLSENDYTTAEKVKLSGIAAGAEVNVPADWNQNDSTKDDYIWNKPYIPVSASDVNALPDSTKYAANLTLTLTSAEGFYYITATLKDQDGNTIGTEKTVSFPQNNVVIGGEYDPVRKVVILYLQGGTVIEFSVADLVEGLQPEITPDNKLSADLVDDAETENKFFTSSERTKLAGIETAAQANVQADWDESDNTSDSYIKNKPEIQNITVDSAMSAVSENPVQNRVITAALGDKVDTSQYSTDMALKANKTTTDGLQSQITSVSGTAGDTATEVTNARTGVDGTVYLTLSARLNAEANMQSDWEQADSTAGDYIKNKPTINNYTNLSNKPSINGVTLQGNKTTSDLNISYTDITDKPTINGTAISGTNVPADFRIPGRIVAGQTYTIDGVTRTAYDGAEVFNHTEANVAVGAYSRATGLATKAIGNFSSANGYQTTARGNYSHTFGRLSEASADYASAEGWECTASGGASHAGGYQSTASGGHSFAYGQNCTASGGHSFAYGQNCTASGGASCAMGAVTTASGDMAYAIGGNTTASGDYAVAEGYSTVAQGINSHACGQYTIARGNNQFVIGNFNIEDTENKFAFIIGNGEAHTYPQPATRSNALAIGWDGKIYTGNNSQGINLETFYSAYLLTVAALSAVSDKAEENRDELAELVDAGAKNLLNPAAAVGYVGQSSYPISKSGITYTLDANSETITLSDTATSVSTLRIPITLKAGTYHVSGIPQGGSDSSYRADLRNAGGNTFITPDFDYGSGFTFTLSETTAVDYCIRVANGYSPDNVKVAPMICTEKAWSVSQQFVKYRPSYDELITRIEALESTVNVNRVVEATRSTRTIEDI